MTDEIKFLDRLGRIIPASAILKKTGFNTVIFAPAGGIHAQAANRINLNTSKSIKP